MSAITAKASRKMKKYAVLTREPRCFLGSFDFSWEQRKLGDIADIVGGGTPSTGNQSYWDGDIDWYAPAEIADQIYANSSQKKITGLGYENSSAKMLPPGTVLFTSRAGIGKTAILTRKGCTNQGFQSIVPHRGELDSYFIFSRTEELKRYGELVGAGSTFVEFSGKQMAVMELMMPPTMREQQTIGGFFQQLDNLITLHQRKCALLFSSFQALISMMFTTSTFSWEQRKLGELALFNPKDELPQTFEYVDLESVVGTEMLSHRAEIKSSAPSRAQRLAHTGDLFYQTVRPYQKNNYLFEKPDNNYVFSTGYAQMRPYVDGYFLLSLVQSERFVKVVLDNCTGTSYPAINANDLAEIEVAAPSDESEAQKIGTIFRSIDNLITLHQRKCISFTGRAGRLISTVNKKRITSSWEQRKLEDYLTVSTEKNTGNIYGRSDVLSVSGDYGIVNQIEFQGRSFAGASVLNYGVVQTGDVVYTKSPLNSNPYGIIKTNKGKPGIVSTLYAVYHPKENTFSDFIQVYFEQHARMNNYMHPLVNKGAKNDMKVSSENALKGPVCFPSRVEQESISAFFSVLDNLITLHQRKPFLMKWRTSDANRNQTNRLVL